MSNSFTEEENTLINWLGSKQWIKDGQFIHCEKTASNTVQVSKFGGAIPHLPNEEVPKCSHCGGELEVLVQLYVPSLPEYARSLLPESLQNSLIVLLICPEDLADEQGAITSRVYTADQIPNLVYQNPKEDAQIQSAIFSNYEFLPTYNDTSNDYLESMDEIDDCAMEELMRKIRMEQRPSKCYFGGFPYFQQGEVNPGDDYTLLLNIEEDENFSMMWGDAGNAQVWVKNDNSNEFYLCWQCG